MTGLTVVLTGLHFQLARVTGVQELAKPEGEIRALLQAWQNYLRHFKVSATQKTVDLITALSVTGFMYVPVGVAIAQKRRAPPPRPPMAGPAQVFQFRPPAGSPAAAAAAPPAGPTNGPVNGPAATVQPSPPPGSPMSDMTYEPEYAPA